MTSLLVNPTLEQVNAELARLCDAANKGQRTRTATMRIGVGGWEAASAMWRAGGDGVPNSYRGAATTTVVGCAWAERHGNRIVRLEATRDAAIKSSFGRRDRLPFNFGGAMTHWDKADNASVTANAPELASVRVEIGAADQLGSGFDLALIAFDPSTLGVVADWLDERGQATVAIRSWLARFAPVACGC